MELNLDTLTIGDYLDLERISGRDMQWWIEFADNDHPLTRASDVLALVCVTQKISEQAGRGLVMSELFGGN